MNLTIINMPIQVQFLLRERVRFVVFHLLMSLIILFFLQINKAKTICECLIASEGIDLKLEEAFCLFLLGQVNYSFWSCSISS